MTHEPRHGLIAAIAELEHAVANCSVAQASCFSQKELDKAEARVKAAREALYHQLALTSKERVQMQQTVASILWNTP